MKPFINSRYAGNEDRPNPLALFDKRTGKWIRHRKVVYLTWYEYLRYAEELDVFQVKWSKYKSWGGKEVVMNTSFWEWWDLYWEKLFGVETRQGMPKVILGTDRDKYLPKRKVPNPQTNAKTLAYFFIVESQKPVNASQIQWNKRGKVKSFGRGQNKVFFNLADNVVALFDTAMDEEVRLTETLRYGISNQHKIPERVRYYLELAHKTLVNVSEGRFL